MKSKIINAIRELSKTNCEFELKFYPALNGDCDIGGAIDEIHKTMPNVHCLSSDEEWEYVIIKSVN